MTVQGKEVKIIKPKTGDREELLRVGAYCRVSTDSDDQLNSFFAQVQHYNDYIRENDSMRLVEIYADEGITGTSVDKRDEFFGMNDISATAYGRKVLCQTCYRCGSKGTRVNFQNITVRILMKQ